MSKYKATDATNKAPTDTTALLQKHKEPAKRLVILSVSVASVAQN